MQSSVISCVTLHAINYPFLINLRSAPDYFGFNSFGDGYYIDPLDVPGMPQSLIYTLKSQDHIAHVASGNIATKHTAYINSEDEDYSVSMSAVMQRRASQRGSRKKGHRAASPMGHVSGTTIGVGKDANRRRSSVYTTSSGE